MVTVACENLSFDDVAFKVAKLRIWQQKLTYPSYHDETMTSLCNKTHGSLTTAPPKEAREEEYKLVL